MAYHPAVQELLDSCSQHIHSGSDLQISIFYGGVLGLSVARSTSYALQASLSEPLTAVVLHLLACGQHVQHSCFVLPSVRRAGCSLDEGCGESTTGHRDRNVCCRSPVVGWMEDMGTISAAKTKAQR